MTAYHLTHLKQLEAESIHIIREVAAEFERPVMLYSVGKDSAVMLQLALKAFFPGKPPFPMLHVDTTWKFREMIEFRDRLMREYAEAHPHYGWHTNMGYGTAEHLAALREHGPSPLHRRSFAPVAQLVLI